MIKKILTAFLLLPTLLCAQINTERVMTIARNALYFEDYVLSIQYFNQVINAKPYLYEPYFFRGLAKINLDDFQGAEADCNAAIQRNPFVVGAYQIRGLARIRQNNYDGAIEDYKTALKYDPENLVLWHNLSLCHMQKEDYGAAKRRDLKIFFFFFFFFMTKVDKVDATCTTDGNKEYYRCTCGKLFEDAAAATEITDHSSVVIPKTGHSYTVQNSDEAHRRSTAADCREFDTYWYTCANDATHSAKDDAAAADKFYNGKQGAHVYGSEWVDCGETGHAHKCQYHDAYDAVQPHTPDHEGGATYDYAVKCTGCGRVLEPQRENGSIRVEVPFKLTVKKTGEMDPGQETFKFAIDRFGAPTVYTLVQDSNT